MSVNPPAKKVEQSRKAELSRKPETIPSGIDPESLVRKALDDIALIIGSASALHHLDDDFVWTVMKRLDRVRVRLLCDLSGLSSADQHRPAPPNPPRVHAAVEEFLVRNHAGLDERGRS